MNPKRLVFAVATSAVSVLMACSGGAVTPPVVPVEVAKIAVTPPGMAIGSTLQKSVPMTGGQVVSADGRLTIDVPTGALTGTQMISVQPISNGGPGGIGAAYRLGPEGVTFAQPVKLTFKYTKAELVGTEALALRVAYQDKEGRWNSLKKFTLDEAAQTVTVETTHFSDWELYTGWKLTPESTSTPPQKFVALQVKVCAADDPGSDELAALVSTCTPDPEFFRADEWAVNGMTGGTQQVGTVSGSMVNGTAQYLAPGQAPASNPVSVSASVTAKSGRKLLLNSTVWIDAHPPLRGIISSLQTSVSNPDDMYSTVASVAFKWNVDADQYEVVSGTFIATHDQKNPGGANCEIHTTLQGPIAVQDGTIIVQENTYYATGRTMGMFQGTTTCTSNGKVEPISLFDSAVWWPVPQTTGLSPKLDGELAENLTGVQAYGAKVNVTWSLRPGQ